jgi:hypothetical protein
VSSSWRQLATRAVRVAVREAPRLLREPGARIRSSQGATRQPGPPVGPSAPATVRPPGAPVGRHLDYAPDLDGRADPGEVVWTWVAFEEDASQGKDRPVLVVGRDGDRLLGLMLSSQAYHQGDQDWCALGAGAWDGEHRPSWVRLDRVLDVPEDGIRREGAVLDRRRFDQVAARLRSQHGWR